MAPVRFGLLCMCICISFHFFAVKGDVWGMEHKVCMCVCGVFFLKELCSPAKCIFAKTCNPSTFLCTELARDQAGHCTVDHHL